jgi:hypothetical protein
MLECEESDAEFSCPPTYASCGRNFPSSLQVRAASCKNSVSKMWTSEFLHPSQINQVLQFRSLYQRDVDDPDNDMYNQCENLIPNCKINVLIPDEFHPLKYKSVWHGTLLKRTGRVIRSWQPRFFQVRSSNAVRSQENGIMSRHPVLEYTSKSKGRRLLIIKDVRREHELDSDFRFSLSLGLVCDPGDADILLNLLPSSSSQRRVMLMAQSDLEAVALLTCLRRILEPGRELPTLRDAMHFPLQALRMLE